MADLNSYTEVIQVAEDVEYPDGYNSIEILGSGDTRQTRIFSSIKITGPTSIVSDGVTIAEYVITIYDPNSTNPFLQTESIFEEASVSGPQEMSVNNWISSIVGVYEDQAETRPIPSNFIEFSENEIHIKDGWSAEGADWDGLRTASAWVRYYGQYTCSVEDGAQTTAKWWARSGDTSTVDPNSVTGTMYVWYIDADNNQPCESSSVPIPNIAGKTAVTRVYYMPDPGSSGTATMNAAYDNVPTSMTTNVVAGSGQADVSLDLNSEPSSITIGEYADLILVATYSNGGPVMSGEAEFYIYKGGGSITTNKCAFSTKQGEVEQVYTSVDSGTELRTNFSLQYPPVRITNIVAIGGGWTYDPLKGVTISGTSVKLIDQEFPEDTIPIEVTYDWGGYALSKYKSGGSDAVDDTVYCGVRFGGHNAICEISISDTSSSSDTGSLELNADDSSVAYSGTTTISIIATDKDGVAGTGTVTLAIVNGKGSSCSPSTVTLGTKALTNQDGSINSTKTFTVNYPIYSLGSIGNIEFLGVNYTAASFSESTVTINETFPVTDGTLTCDYTAKGYGETTFTAGVIETDCYIVGTWSGADPDTIMISVSETGTGTGDGSLTVSAEDSSLSWQGTTTVTVSATDSDGNPGVGSVAMSVAGGGGSIVNSITLGTKVLTGQKGSVNGLKTFTIDYPTTGSVTNIKFLGVSYTAASVEGTTVTITGEFPTVTGECTCDYTASGIGQATFTAPNGSPDDNEGVECYVTGRWSGADPDACTITVSADGGGTESGNASLNLSGSPLNLGYGEVASITVDCTDSEGNSAINSVTYTIDPPGLGTLVKPTEGSQGTYQAPMGAATIDITAHFTDPITRKQLSSSVTFVVSNGDDEEEPGKDTTITLAADPSEIAAGEESTVTATVMKDGSPLNGILVSMRSSGIGSIGGAIADKDGLAKAKFTTTAEDKPETVTITGYILTGAGEKSGTCSITVGEPEPGEQRDTTIDVSGELKPTLEVVKSLKNAVLLSAGIANTIDEYWCVQQDPSLNKASKMLFAVPFPAGLVPAGGKIVNITCSAAGWEPPDSWKSIEGTLNYNNVTSVEAYVEWAFEKNSALEQKVYVGDKADPSIPIIGATVTVLGQSVVTDDKGFATFKGLLPAEYDILISHPNYITNTADTDSSNDKFTVKPYSSRPWRLNTTAISFNVVVTIEYPKPDTKEEGTP